MEHRKFAPASPPSSERLEFDSSMMLAGSCLRTGRRIRSEPALGHDSGEANAEVARTCAEILTSAGPMEVLACLNSRTRFRFTGLYRAASPYLHNLYLYDRENPSLNVSGEISRLDDTYCGIVCAEDHLFATINSGKDGRLTTHAARERVISYCGVPIRRESGVIWGTLCHYDVRPRLLPRFETGVLQLVARIFGSSSILEAS